MLPCLDRAGYGSGGEIRRSVSSGEAHCPGSVSDLAAIRGAHGRHHHHRLVHRGIRRRDRRHGERHG